MSGQIAAGAASGVTRRTAWRPWMAMRFGCAVGSRLTLPVALRAFLLTLAVVDDLVVIVIIALVFTESVHWLDLLVAFGLAAVWRLLQRRRISAGWLLLPLGMATWWFMHESGVHATNAGVLLGLLTRVRRDPGEEESPAQRLEHRLEPISACVAVPFFAFVSAGVPLTGGSRLLHDPIVLGVLAGLVVGKPLGVLGGAYLVTRFTHAALNPNLTWGSWWGWRPLLGSASPCRCWSAASPSTAPT